MPEIVIVPQGQTTFVSQHPYNEQRIKAAAIYCSDGRFGGHCDDFLHNALRLPRYDRLVVPGGPAALAGDLTTYREGEALTQQLSFLIEAHGLERLVLIAHESCAFYTNRLFVAPPDLMHRQFQDLRKAAERIANMSSRLSVEAHMAWRRGDHIVFEPVPSGAASHSMAPNV